jgi:RNAse (barnase) inhibitor barstar
MVQCNDREKALYASGQLVGAASAWWDSYINGHEQPQSIVWKEFKDNFTSNYTPASVTKLERKEFLGLKQGQMTVIEYRDNFIELSRYAPRAVEGDMEKLEQFLEGLNADL